MVLTVGRNTRGRPLFYRTIRDADVSRCATERETVDRDRCRRRKQHRLDHEAGENGASELHGWSPEPLPEQDDAGTSRRFEHEQDLERQLGKGRPRRDPRHSDHLEKRQREDVADDMVGDEHGEDPAASAEPLTDGP